MSASNTESPDPTRMASLLRMSDSNATLFEPAELAAILQHQLAAPIEYDLSGVDRGKARRLKTNASCKGLLLKSFADLLHHPQPPIELLEMTKQFAKANRNDPDSAFPTEIATLLYYSCIAAALARCRTRITELDDAAISDGFKWAVQQPWVDEPTAGLFTEALQVLRTPKEGDR